MTFAIDLTQAVGLGAAFCTTVAFLPQALKAWRSRSVGDLSLVTFLVFAVGVTLWLAYGLMTRDVPIILANGVTLVLACAILTMRVLFAGRPACDPKREASGDDGPPS